MLLKNTLVVLSVFVMGSLLLPVGPAAAEKYEPHWQSLDKRPIPKWFAEAKFGIFVVWGPYSVPAWVDRGYAEWYGARMYEKDSPVYKFHRQNYGEDFDYERFAPMFRAELWDPNSWVDLFVRSGAKYVVTTAKYHDGFCLWPYDDAKTIRTDKWNATVVGPQRDLLGELNEAGRKCGLRMGIYFSLYEWWHPLWQDESKRDLFVEHMHRQFKDVVTKYRPPIIFLDGEWSMDYAKWRSEELAAWLYNESPVKDEVVVNDRWGKTRRLHGDYYSSEYGGGNYPPTHPWQEDRGIGHSYGYNRNETIYDYDSADELIRMLSRVVGNGGNLLLDVGPTADGRIPVIMQQRLLEIGKWLAVNGPAIYATHANPFWPRKFPWGTVTTRDNTLYLHVHDRRDKSISIEGIHGEIERAYLLSRPDNAISFNRDSQAVTIHLPEYMPDEPVSIITLEMRPAAG